MSSMKLLLCAANHPAVKYSATCHTGVESSAK